MAIKITEFEMTKCYKCEKDLLAVKSAVHPLCDDCEESFQKWFDRELEVIS